MSSNTDETIVRPAMANSLADAVGNVGDTAPEKIGKYEVYGLIGRGASGLVYKGFDPFVHRDVAIKVALQQLEQSRFDKNPSQARNFFAEARAAGMLAHPHIVSLYDAGMEGDLSYIVMELVEGDTLAPFCKRNGPRLEVGRVLDTIFKCARALDYSHARGVLHRDVKPTNIMMSHDGVPKIMDFSIAEIAQKTPTGDGMAVGSPLYMSPEQVARQAVGPSSDLYSLGAVLYQMLTGEPPFLSNSLPGLFAAIRNAPVPRLEHLRPDLPKGLDDLLARLLAKKPADRPQTGAAMAAEVSRLYTRMRNVDKATTPDVVLRLQQRDAMRTLSAFRAFSDDELEEFLSVSQFVPLAAGTVLPAPDHTEPVFYCVGLGVVEILRDNQPATRFGKGDLFGDRNAPAGAAVVRAQRIHTLAPSMLLRIPGPALERLTPETQLRFYQAFARSISTRTSLVSPRDTRAS